MRSYLETILAVLLGCLIGMFVVLPGSGCGHGLTPGYRALAIAGKVANGVGRGMAAYCKAKRLSCEKLPAPAAVKECMGKTKCKAALASWVKVVKPAYNTAAGVAWAALEVAHAAGKKKLDWIKLLAPVVCIALKAADDWREMLGKAFGAVVGPLRVVEGLVCK